MRCASNEATGHEDAWPDGRPMPCDGLLTRLGMAQGDLGHTDLQEDLEFHHSNFHESAAGGRKGRPASNLPPPVTAPSSSSPKRFLWFLSFYAQFFDVDTSAVLSRCWAALFPRANFLDVLEGNPDLYGPFWIATTVVLILFLGGTISKYLAATRSTPFAYDFRLLSGEMPPSACLCSSMRGRRR